MTRRKPTEKKIIDFKNGILLIPGTLLTADQKAMLPFKGMSNEKFVNNNSFYFINGAPASETSGYYYPVCTSLKHLPY